MFDLGPYIGHESTLKLVLLAIFDTTEEPVITWTCLEPGVLAAFLASVISVEAVLRESNRKKPKQVLNVFIRKSHCHLVQMYVSGWFSYRYTMVNNIQYSSYVLEDINEKVDWR